MMQATDADGSPIPIMSGAKGAFRCRWDSPTLLFRRWPLEDVNCKLVGGVR